MRLDVRLQIQKRLYAKQFGIAKLEEYKSWSQENDVYDFIDMRKHKIQNYITGRWVLIVKKDAVGVVENLFRLSSV